MNKRPKGLRLNCRPSQYLTTLKVKENRLQYLIYFGISLWVMGLTWLTGYTGITRFQLFFGSINPLIVVFFVVLLGFFLLSFLSSKAGLVIYSRRAHREVFYSYMLAAVLFAGIAVVDLKIGFPKDMNAEFPESLLFYPSIGFVVEVLFHLLPLSLFFFLLTISSKKIDNEKIMWAGILLVSLLEPVFQALPDIERYPLWVSVYVGLNVYMINLIQLAIFKKYDFISMYSFRLVYYLLWHILWGYLRLKLLF